MIRAATLDQRSKESEAIAELSPGKSSQKREQPVLRSWAGADLAGDEVIEKETQGRGTHAARVRVCEVGHLRALSKTAA